VRVARLSYAKLPAQRVRQPALRVQADDIAYSVLVARLQHFDAQINGRPPTGPLIGGLQYVCNFVDRAFNLPVSDEVVFIARYLALNFSL